MVKVSLRLDTRYKRKDGTFQLKIAVFRDNTAYIPLNVYLHKDEWDNKKQEVTKLPQRKSLNVLTKNKLAEVEMRLLHLQDKGLVRSLTDKQLLQTLSGENDADRPHLFSEYMEKYIETINNTRTKEIYLATKKKLVAYCDYSDITFEQMNVSWLKAFDAWLQKSTPSINARSIHLRNIRTIFNSAIDDGFISCYPFRRFKIKYQETIKRAITVKEFRKLLQAETEPFRQKYKDCFLLMFYLIGINIADLANLQVDAVQNGRIRYYRAKTHKLYDVKVEPEAQEIIDHYKGTRHLLSFFDNVSDYRHFAMRMNNNLKEIAKDNGLPKITTYVARHSWSTYASELDIPRDVISHALGHSVNVTDTYIRYNHAKVDEANRRVIDYLLGKGTP